VELLKADLFLISCIALFTSVGCKDGTPKNNPQQNVPGAPKHLIRKKPPSSFSDSLFIDSRSVVFFAPDSVQMENIKEVNEEVIFESLEHDCYYQMRNARQVIEKYWPGLPVKLASKDRWLVFRRIHGADSIVDLNHINDICGIFLFDPGKNPVRITMTNIDSELGFYFSKK
jgi:hypothetical protein